MSGMAAVSCLGSLAVSRNIFPARFDNKPLQRHAALYVAAHGTVDITEAEGGSMKRCLIYNFTTPPADQVVSGEQVAKFVVD